MKNTAFLIALTLATAFVALLDPLSAQDRLTFEAKDGGNDAPHVVLIAGDEEYRTEESMPMLGKILSQKHGFKCTVLFSFGPDGASYIDPNNQQGLRLGFARRRRPDDHRHAVPIAR